MIRAIAINSRHLCLQGTCRSFKYFPRNALLSFCRNMKSTVHVSYARVPGICQGHWYCLALPWLAHMISGFFWHQFKSSAARHSPCFHIVACVCSLQYHHLYTIFHIVAWVCSFVSKHLEAYLHLFVPHSLLPLFVLHPSRHHQISNNNLDKLLSLPRGKDFSTWRLLNLSVGTTLCLPLDLK